MNFLDKKETRKELKNILSKNKEHFENWSNQICKKIAETTEYKDASTILAYMNLPDEVGLSPLVLQAIKDNKKVYIPRIVPGTTVMDFYQYKEDSIDSGTFGIWEPDNSCPKLDLDSQLQNQSILVLVPGRGFTKDGKRIGRGKGFYDTYLTELNKKGDSAKCKITFFGICFKCQLLPDLPTEAHDILMNQIISEE